MLRQEGIAVTTLMANWLGQSQVARWIERARAMGDEPRQAGTLEQLPHGCGGAPTHTHHG